VFVPTGQTGIAIAGWGTSIDRVVTDFAPGAAEQLVLEGERRASGGAALTGAPEQLVLEGERQANSGGTVPGAAQQLVVKGDRRADAAAPLLVVEGQGGINHPAYAPVTLALLYGSAPDALVLVHIPSRTVIDGYDVPLLGYRELIRRYEMLCAGIKPAKVVAIALNTKELSDADARAAIADATAQTGLPCDDVVRNGPFALYDAIAPQLAKTAVLHG
jgi:uncharacterized NAD-dependent epimerase/dehydratase family protein